ncbi:bacteriochlorophyll/chlorophyll synthetase [Methylocella silvestris BL2]|uniref:Bacteriochlorophyll/chlorophyll synthetase n=1 Tax=Methylocella silvestris (strain DSM 15510 / CIP 108128 / LMG 27833 / NCIMB 13906 / BL2) TaxID=395965 RepID=B8EPZ7_METSB|nr:chlorophyll synthase ChlG [Methylocella silvestris]ACK51001.1 bacteriochlorophyll/chlorophyll synthetase [Methylocella silvestris BL2]
MTIELPHGDEASAATALPRPGAVLELLKPVTWFPPMWAFGCGVASQPGPVGARIGVILSGIVLAGPLVCATSQAVNDWFDRHVDAINEPGRPIPSGRVPGRWGLGIACGWTLLSLFVAALIGVWVFVAAALGLALAWAYSAPPLRLKQNGWFGNSACALCYEGLAWVTGAAVMADGALPDWRIFIIAFLYSAGAHGIMTLNDFKSVEGDRRMGIGSLPALLGVERAARVACIFMAIPQIFVVALLTLWGCPVHAIIILLALIAQCLLMPRLLENPRARAPWYNGTGVTLYVLGMLVSAFALRSILAGGA